MSDEVREGYKETVIGIIPKQWGTSQLRNICTKVTDGTHGTPKLKEEGYPFITAKNITNGKLDFSSCGYISKEEHEKIISRSKPERGDILFTHVGTIGQVIKVDVDFEFSIKNVALFKPNKQHLTSDYFKYCLEGSLVQNFITRILQGGVQSYLSLTTLRGLNVPLPSLPEQKKIADILSTVDQAIAKTDEIIEKTKELKKGLMQELLTKGIGHDEFKEVKIGPKKVEIPLEWEKKRFRDITEVRQGLQIAISKRFKQKKENRHLYITVQHLNNPNDDKHRYYIEDPRESVICGKKDILMNRTGNTGEVVTGVEGVFHNNFFLVDYEEELVDKDFLYYYLNSKEIQHLIKVYAGTTTIPDLNHGDFYNIPFLSPLLEEQKKIANILSTVDKKIQKKQEKKEKLERLKKGLMQKLLTGKVRVSIDDA